MMTQTQLLDLLERTAWTFVQCFIGIITAQNLVGNGDLSAWKAAGIAAGLAAIKSVIAQQFGNGTSSSLPASVEPLPNESAAVDLSTPTD